MIFNTVEKGENRLYALHHVPSETKVLLLAAIIQSLRNFSSISNLLTKPESTLAK